MFHYYRNYEIFIKNSLDNNYYICYCWDEEMLEASLIVTNTSGGILAFSNAVSPSINGINRSIPFNNPDEFVLLQNRKLVACKPHHAFKPFSYLFYFINFVSYSVSDLIRIMSTWLRQTML